MPTWEVQITIIGWLVNIQHPYEGRNSTGHSSVVYQIIMIVVNAWVIHKFLHKEKERLDLVSFRRAVCVPYLKLAGANRRMGRKSTAPSPSTRLDDVRYDGKDHFIAKRENQRRCQKKSCSRKPRAYCAKCNITLCLESFSPYRKQ